MKYLTTEDWAEFRNRFPAAASFMDGRDLQRELEYLEEVYQKHPNSLNQWSRDRLAELREWKQSTLRVA